MRRLLPGVLVVVLLLLHVPVAAVAQPTDLGTYTLFARGEVRLKSGAFVSQGNVGSNFVKVLLAPDASVSGAVAAYLIDARVRSVIYGDAYYGILRARGNPPGTVLGTAHTPLTSGFVTEPPPPTVLPPNLPRVDVAPHSYSVLGPGRYPAITTSDDAGVVLSNGTYDVGDFLIRGKGSFVRCADVATCTVRVGSRLLLAVDRVNTTGDVPDLVGTLSF